MAQEEIPCDGVVCRECPLHFSREMITWGPTRTSCAFNLLKALDDILPPSCPSCGALLTTE